MKKAIGFYPRPDVDTTGSQVVSQAGAVLLTETVTAVGLDHALSTALARWRPRLAVHDPAKVLLISRSRSRSLSRSVGLPG